MSRSCFSLLVLLILVLFPAWSLAETTPPTKIASFKVQTGQTVQHGLTLTLVGDINNPCESSTPGFYFAHFESDGKIDQYRDLRKLLLSTIMFALGTDRPVVIDYTCTPGVGRADIDSISIVE
jgi:hypothetical protein